MNDRGRLSEELTELACSLADAAGSLAVSMVLPARATASTKSTATDVVTEADKAAEALITERLLAARPDDSIIGEEGASRIGTSGVTWHIDPIDGTTNFLYAIPAFSVSIAADVSSTVVAGAVVNPVLGDVYHATLGRGAFRNGERLQLGEPPELETSLVATGFGYRSDERANQGKVVAALLPEIRDIRRFGSAALDLCAVASGQVDAYYERGLNRWDLAAGALIAAEAGATVGDLRGGEPSSDFVLAAKAPLFESLAAQLRKVGADHKP